ncbi:hypothetical protein GCM10023144_39840 [Pigmentiphaga soli]|uniref:Uncharacterized protein n=1 Tax=Pigmentiphaga soli TaxID=1007095 RepID=A0ABP8HJL9_9BURK
MPGIDLLLGGNDLTLKQASTASSIPRVRRCHAEYPGGGKRHGKYVGLGGIWDTKALGRYVDQGVRFIPTSADIQFMMQGASDGSAGIRKLKA